MNYIKKINEEFKFIPDLIIRKIKYGFSNVHIFYIETLSSGDRINDYILKNITNPNKFRNLKNILATPNFKEITFSEFETYLFNGFTIILYHNKFYATETRADLDRSISPPQIEQDLYGAKDALVENYQKNLGLIKRRIKSKHLKTFEYKLGTYTNTNTALLYIEDIAKDELVQKCDKLLKNINVDRIIDAGELKQYLAVEGKAVFPATKLT